MATPQQNIEPYPVPAAQPAPAPLPNPQGCQFCGGTPTLKTTVRGHQGMVIIMRFLKVRGLFCRTCGIAVHREMTTKTLWQGWWGIASLVIAPITLVINLVARVRFGRMTPPANGMRPPLDPGKPVIRRAGAIGVLAPFLIVGAVALGAELDDSADTAEVGACMHIGGTENAPEANVVDCGSAEAQFKVAERHEGSDAHCDRTVYSEYAEYGGRESFTLCLAPLP
ncbi:hypothetical protein [Streptomyces sp. NPDC001068]|uniref:LppU/SCO3897 family protein n=1 Tax=Streptomyces sp. NPDC001068 TaxID=3364544 RepID=UPI0036A06061